jgi:oligopeptide transport system substrate-binding protein
VHHKPFDDVRVREAVSLAFDREIMVEKVTRAGEQPAYAFVPAGMPGYHGAELRFRHMSMAARRARARKLLAEAGFTPDRPLKFDLNTSNATESRQVSVALQGMWSEVGIQARLMPYDSQIHYNMLRKRDFDVTLAGWIADYRDPKNYLMLYESTTTDLNYGGYSNTAFDSLVGASDNERDVPAREELLRRAEQVLLDDVAVAPVYFGVARNLVSPQVRGFADNNVNIHRSRFLSLDRDDKTV